MIIDIVKGVQLNIFLVDVLILMLGYLVMLRDICDYYECDMWFIVVVIVVVVILIFMVLLCVIVVLLYLVGLVVILYMLVIGFGVVVFQVFLGQELYWSVFGLVFVVLVVVGVDYNMLLVLWLWDELVLGVCFSVICMVCCMGGVIMVVGLIFVVLMFGLLFFSIGIVV